MKKIEFGYFRYLNQISDFPILIIEINNIDFVQNSQHFQQIKDVIFNSDYKLGINNLIF